MIARNLQLWCQPLPNIQVQPLQERRKWADTLYSAKILWVFNFVNFQPFVKIFQRKFLTCSMQCVRAANSQNCFNKIFKITIRKNLDP